MRCRGGEKREQIAWNVEMELRKVFGPIPI